MSEADVSDRFWPFGIWWAVSLTSLMLAWALSDARSEVLHPIQPKRSAPGLVVSFQGGVVGENIAKVLDKVSEIPGVLNTATYTIRGNETTCGIIQKVLEFPAPCEPIARFLDKLNPQQMPSKRTLKSGDVIVLPDLSLTTYLAGQSFSKRSEQDIKKYHSILQNWRDLSPDVKERPNSIEVQYRAYELYIPTPSDDVSLALSAKLQQIRSTNVLINILREEPTATRLHAAASTAPVPSLQEIEDACRDNKSHDIRYEYQALSPAEWDAVQIVQSNLPSPAKRVTVFMIDVDLLGSPNLDVTDSDPSRTSGWPCHWNSHFLARNHATHLAGIIASRPTFGFKGLALDVAAIEPFPWAKPKAEDSDEVIAAAPDRQFKLADLIARHWRDFPRPIYLAAVDFAPWQPELVYNGRLRNDNIRFTRVPESTIKERRPLLIVAAGQPKPGGMPEPLTPTTAMSPQDLGDQPNVIVVTACQVCSSTGTQLQPSANFGSGDHKYVHVAAPGGSPIPGWISDSDLGGAAGTSQAAAYVAGVAALMVGHYCEDFSDASSVKTRLQITSRPIAGLGDGAANSAADSIAAGIVDPILALLPPRKHWLKNSSGWRQVGIKSWSSDKIVFTNPDSGETFTLDGQDIRRFVRNPGNDLASARWTIYSDKSLSHAWKEGEVWRFSSVRPPDAAKLILCDAEGHVFEQKLTGIDDLVVALSGPGSNECAKN